MLDKITALPTIEHTGFLENQSTLPDYILPEAGKTNGFKAFYSCNYCGVGDSGLLQSRQSAHTDNHVLPEIGEGKIRLDLFGQETNLTILFGPHQTFKVLTQAPLAERGEILDARIAYEKDSRRVRVRAEKMEFNAASHFKAQHFSLFRTGGDGSQTLIHERMPTAGCVKLNASLGLQRPVFPYHTGPSVLDVSRRRVPITYAQGISRLAQYLLDHRGPHDRTSLYACGQVDYFTIFALQEVFRLLGARNIGGNAEHCLNAGALHNEMLTGQEGPFLTIDQSVDGPGRFFLLNGWNGLVTHPPVYHRLTARKDLDAYIVDVALTESAQDIAARLGQDRVLLIRPATDPHLALSVAHMILHRQAGAIKKSFITQYSDPSSFHRFAALARSEDFKPETVAKRIAPEKHLEKRILDGILDIALKLGDRRIAPINIPSVGLSQTKGAISHCLWGDAMAMVGKYGLKPDGSPAGGTLRLPGQINAQTEIQGLNRNIFFGRVPVTEAGAVEAARRMDLPDRAYRKVLDRDPPRAVLDYADPTPLGETELIIILGTQFDSNMMNRNRWIKKLKKKDTTTLVVIDPIPDPFALEWADLILPSPPHIAATKLYQNGEWRLTLSVPQKRAPKETRTDATIIYDAMAEVSRRLRNETKLLAEHQDLKQVVRSGYLRHRFESKESGGWLPRVDGEVHRPYLWKRIIRYMSNNVECSSVGGGSSTGKRSGDLYCRPEHPDGSPITWEDLLKKGSIVYGGVGTTRYRLDYEDKEHVPFRDLYRRPCKFKFFTPTKADLEIPEGILLTSGRSALSEDKARVHFAIATYNSGKHTSPLNMPEENPLYLPPILARTLGLRQGDLVKIANVETGHYLVLPIATSHRVKGNSIYISFHKCRAEMELGRYVNILTSHTQRCPYTDQTKVKATPVTLELIQRRELRR